MLLCRSMTTRRRKLGKPGWVAVSVKHLGGKIQIHKKTIKINKRRLACDVFDSYLHIPALLMSLMQTAFKQNGSTQCPVLTTAEHQFSTNGMRN